MGLESATYISDFTTTNPAGADQTSQGDDHIRLVKSVAQSTFPNATKAFRFPNTVVEQTAGLTVSFPTDLNKLYPVSASGASRTVNLPDPSSGGTVNEDGFTVYVMKTDSSANTVTIDGNGSQTINGALTLVLTKQWQIAKLQWDKLDAEWYAFIGLNASLTDILEDTTPQLGGDLDANAHNLGFDDATGITDDAGNEQIIFHKTASAVNQVGVTNAATTNAPILSAEGGDANIDLKLAGKGSGVPKIGTNAIQHAGSSVTLSQLPVGTVVQRVYATYALNADLTTVIPLDDTIPQNTEGTEIVTAAITPASVTNRIAVRFKGEGALASGSHLIAALFQDSVANALSTGTNRVPATASNQIPVSLDFEHVPGTVNAITYKIRVGADSGTARMNGSTSARRFGGTSLCTLILEEIKAS